MRTVDLFAGGGGLSLGFMKAGFEVVAAFDNWKAAIELYRKNIKTHTIFTYDLEQENIFDQIAQFKPEMIIGGPPCQDFSSAGKRDETQGRANLTIAFANIVKNILPKFFVMENVARAQKSVAFANAKQILSDSGYGLNEVVLDASYCGVPQRRKRLFLIGAHSTNDDFLKHIIKKNLSEKPMTLRDYFGDSLGVEHYYRHPRSYKRRGIFSIDEPSPTIRGVNRPLPAGYPGHKGDSAAITNKIRPLTAKERSRIQTFPESYLLVGTKTGVEQIIGNAVPVNLANYVAECINEYLQEQVENNHPVTNHNSIAYESPTQQQLTP